VKAFFTGLGAFDHLVFTAGETLQIGRLSDIDIAAARAFFGLRYWGAYMAAEYCSIGHTTIPHVCCTPCHLEFLAVIISANCFHIARNSACSNPAERGPLV
jgi:hypothetical protein